MDNQKDKNELSREYLDKLFKETSGYSLEEIGPVYDPIYFKNFFLNGKYLDYKARFISGMTGIPEEDILKYGKYVPEETKYASYKKTNKEIIIFVGYHVFNIVVKDKNMN